MESRLIFVVSGPEGYGIRSVWRSLFKILRNGYTIKIAVLDKRFKESWEEEFSGVEVVSPSSSWAALPSRNLFGRIGLIFRRGISQLKLAGWLSSHVQQRSDKAIVFQGPIDSLLCGLVARKKGIPALWFVPNAVSSGRVFDMNKRIYRGLFKFGNVVPISNSRYTDSTFGSGHFLRHVVHLGIDTAKYASDCDGVAVREQYAIPKSNTVVGLFARMTPSKGQLRMVRAMAELPDDIHLLLCGGPLEGEYFEQVLSEVTRLHLQGRVHFVGFQDDLRDYYAASDIVANLRSDPEPFGLTVVEGMACAKPVLAHAAGGPSETIVDGETGWLISSPDSEAIREGVVRAMNDKGRWPAMGRAGQDRVKCEFSLDSFGVRARQVLKDVVECQE